MKKIIYLLITVSSLILYSSCSPKISHTHVVEDTRKKPVPGVHGIIVLHPVDNTAHSGTKDYPFFYDGVNETLDFTDQIDDYKAARDSLPEYITVSNLGHGFEMESMSAYPFVNFTAEAKQEIATKSGLRFSGINNYRISYASNTQILPAGSKECMEMLLNILQQKPELKSKLDDSRTAVTGGVGMLTMHPGKNIIEDAKGNKWYVFYDYGNKRIYISDDPTAYDKFSEALPLVVSYPQNAVLVQGIDINPFTFFDPTALEAMAKEKGLEINAKQDTVIKVENGDTTITKTDLSLNGWKVLKISNDAIVLDYQRVIKRLEEKLGVQSSTPSPAEAHADISIENKQRVSTASSPGPKKQTRTSSSPVSSPSGSGRGVYDANHHN